MDEQIKQIAERLKGLRDALDLNVADMARKSGVAVEDYRQYESGNADIPMSFLCSVAQQFGIELSSLISGEDAHMSVYSVTRKGKGPSVERTKEYKYQSLSSGFKNPDGKPFIVTVEPKPVDYPIHLNTHPDQEFNLVLEGKLYLQIGGKEIILNEGDSIYFDASKSHGMKAMDNKAVKFLAIIL